MNDQLIEVEAPPRVRVPLPEPTQRRWQPLRLGLVELYRYDSEEFWFRDGHLLLRGNNGTGKSKVLSLSLPLLFDAQLRPSRLEPDGDPGKKMAWNLLLHDAYDRRVGYSWIEFGRRDDDGMPRYLTLGAGLSAVAARPQVESWFFIVDDASHARIGENLWLVNTQRVVLNRERLRDALDGRGQVFETAAAYRRAVDERLFHLGTRRYDALMDTLIQLRQPQLSRKPDEASLSAALTDALPPLPQDLLADIAEAMSRLEEDRRQLEGFEQLARAVERFDQRYRVYAGTLSRRQARELRQAQTAFDDASRERNAAQARLLAARGEEEASRAARQAGELALAGQRARLETLQSNPTMQDANRLDTAERDARAREREASEAKQTRTDADKHMAHEAELTQARALEASQAERILHDVRNECTQHAEDAGLAAEHARQGLAALTPSALAEWPQRAFDGAPTALRELVQARREQVALLRRHQARVADAEHEHHQRRQRLDDLQEEAEAAAARRTEADTAVERSAQALTEAWSRHVAALKQLRIDGQAAASALADWVAHLRGDNPALAALREAQIETSDRLAAQRTSLDAQAETLRIEHSELEHERERLLVGEDAIPPRRHTRGEGTRAELVGSVLWRLIDFREHVDAKARAGIEAALEAAGLLDAWVTPDGCLIETPDGGPWHDVQLVARPSAVEQTLAQWLRPTPDIGSPLVAAVVTQLLDAVACGPDDTSHAEAWVASDGRFRLAGLCGAWAKPEAVYIGYAARAAARERRLAEIALRLEQLERDDAALASRFEDHTAARRRAEQEWRAAPSDQELRQVHVRASVCAHEFQSAQAKLSDAGVRCREAEEALHIARAELERDATDLRLPPDPSALSTVEEALHAYDDARHRLLQAAQQWRRAVPELLLQRNREADARDNLERCDRRLAERRVEAEQAGAILQVLRETVGAQVVALRAQVAAARNAVHDGEAALRAAEDVLGVAGEKRAVAAKQAEVADERLTERGESRAQAVSRLQRFVASGLLASALPALELPDVRESWTIDPALALARRSEQLLVALKDDDQSWKRVQHQITEDLQELQRSLSALGHQAAAEPSDFGLVVHIVYQNRSERPDRLAAMLADEITQRRELLTAHEREVLENHLQAEIASEVQRLMQAAERQVAAINHELHKRPTSTGVRFRLQWLPLAESEGAPVGLQAACARLLNMSADLWSAEDRRVVGVMLQQRVADERTRADVAFGADGSIGLIDQLARALDYRRWHAFRVQRLQDGQWRKLSGPASSGERALGLTVPLFAAIASFYSQSGQALAPRLILLDEAFAGIDDAARAHCMGLIREFDLDFVITSEREWGCYAELPGVAICQLQRREGIDAVYVSRWTWDGRAKRRVDDPDRRFPTTA